MQRVKFSNTMTRDFKEYFYDVDWNSSQSSLKVFGSHKFESFEILGMFFSEIVKIRIPTSPSTSDDEQSSWEDWPEFRPCRRPMAKTSKS